LKTDSERERTPPTFPPTQEYALPSFFFDLSPPSTLTNLHTSKLEEREQWERDAVD
jgi:hypothetical protein